MKFFDPHDLSLSTSSNTLTSHFTKVTQRLTFEMFEQVEKDYTLCYHV